jgi:CubicO group peptidase (beta-lactamase class C family)
LTLRSRRSTDLTKAAAGYAVASATDMGRLLIALTARTILSPATLRSMMTTQATLHPEVPGWGYGVQLDSVNGRQVAEHGGDIGGFAALLTVVPDVTNEPEP